MEKLVNGLVSVFFLVTGAPTQIEKESSPHIQYAHEIAKSVVEELKTSLQLECEGDGGSLADNVSEISLLMYAKRRATIDEARQLYVRATEKFRTAVNQHQAIRPYLAEYPFPPQRARLAIRFDLGLKDYSGDSVADVSIGNDGILYYYKETTIPSKRIEIHHEPYADALTMVEHANLSDADICKHLQKPYEDALDELCFSFFKTVYKRLGVRPSRLGGDAGEKIKELAFVFVRTQRTHVEEARKLEVTIVKNLLERINTSATLRPYLATYPFGPEQVKVEIDFRNKRMFPFDDGSLCSVCQQNGTILYHKEDSFDGPTIPLEPVFVVEEPYLQALQKVSSKQTVKKL